MLRDLVNNDLQAKDAAKGLWECATLPETGIQTVEGYYYQKALYRLTIESETPWKGGSFKEFCDHWQVLEYHTEKPPN